MAEYSRIACGTYVSTGSAQQVNVPFLPRYVRVNNLTGESPPRLGTYTNIYSILTPGSQSSFANIITSTGYSVVGGTTLGLSLFSAGLSLQFGAQQQIQAITKANPAVVTVVDHELNTGDVVVFEGLYQSSTTGMPQICGMPFAVTVVDDNVFTINYNTNQSNFTALSGSPAGAFFKKVLYPYLYAPADYFINSISNNGGFCQIGTTVNHSLVVGSEVSFRIPARYGSVQLNANASLPGAPLYGIVTSVNSSSSVTVNIPYALITAFNNNIPVSAVAGLSFPQVVTVGDINTGGGIQNVPSVGGNPTINGPSVNGAFVNNTRQGFIVGLAICGLPGDVMFWQALAPDYVSGF